ncbi:MAG: alkane 1-monooxygenase [Marinovum sp.]|nr:alkane 1-monooxygenase [Marinovum sp.]
MIWFTIASLLPAFLLGFGAVLGGVWPLLGVVSITVLVFFLDKLANRFLPENEAWTGHGLSLGLAVGHLVLLPIIIWSVGAGAHLDTLDKVLLVTGAGLWFGQVSHSNAHELVHRADRWGRRLGKLLYASLLYGHHGTAHIRVHHIHAATDLDPNSARLGEGFWSFCLRCAAGEYTAGLKAENAARARRAKSLPLWTHPYLTDAAISAISLGLAFWLAGWPGILALVVVAIYAAWQLMLSDYVQHYGLRRHTLPSGKLEPMGPQHSWNAPKWYSSAMMLNAPRHSDHHVHPGRAFPALQLDQTTMPTLPQSLPVMAVIALVPPFWHRLMDHRAQRWRLKSQARGGAASAKKRTPPRTISENAGPDGHKLA